MAITATRDDTMLTRWIGVAVGLELAFVGLRVLGDWRAHALIFLLLFAGAFLVFLLGVWPVLRRDTTPDLSLRAALCFFGVTGLLFRMTLLPLTPTLSDDIYRYLWDGRVQVAGINPYAYPPNAPALAHLQGEMSARINHPDIRTIYPPLMQHAFHAATRVQPTVAAHKGLFVICDVLLMLLLFCVLPRWRAPRWWGVLYAWNPLVMVEIAGSGHNDVLGLVWLVIGCWLWTFHRPIAKRSAMVAWGLGVLAKFVPLLLMPWILMRRERWRYLGWFMATIVMGYLPYLSAVSLGESAWSLYGASWEFNSSVYALLMRIIASPVVVRTALLLAVVGWGVWVARRDAELPDYLLAMMGAMVIMSPVVEPWYVVWMAPFLCMRPRVSWLMFCGLVTLSYVVLIGYMQDGRWIIPVWVTWVEYGGLLALLTSELIHRRYQLPPVDNVGRVASPAGYYVSAIIPAWNEEDAIGAVLREIPRDVAREVIVVDNGSTDRTAEVARAHGATVVDEPRRGYGQACVAGIAALSPETDIVVFLDADHADYPEEMAQLVAPLARNKADLVIGSRVLGGAPRDSLTPQQRAGNWLACQLIAWRWGHRYTDLGPFRAIRRTTLRALAMRDRTYGWTVEMQLKALQHGVRVMEIPVRYRRRIGRSKISGTVLGTIRAGVTILSTIARSATVSRRKTNLASSMQPTVYS